MRTSSKMATQRTNAPKSDERNRRQYDFNERQGRTIPSAEHRARFSNSQKTLMKCTHLAVQVYFIVSLVSGFYVELNYVVPLCYEQYGEVVTYHMKVLTCFLFYGVAANWICTRFYSTHFTLTQDKPNLVKTLWDDHKVGEAISDTNERQVLCKTHPHLMYSECLVCQHQAPPRSHHCWLCNQCTLKHEVHSILIGKCIGFYNQRYFIVLCFYISICSIIYWSHYAYYLHNFFLLRHQYYDLLLTRTIWLWVQQQVSLQDLVIITNSYSFLLLGAMTLKMFLWQMYAVSKGQTTYELRNRQFQVHRNTSVKKNFQEVFGEFWPLNFFIPTQLFFRQRTDGKEWRGMEITPLCTK